MPLPDPSIRRLSQRETAQRVGVSVSTLHNYRNRPRDHLNPFPPGYRYLSGRVYWPETEVDLWIRRESALGAQIAQDEVVTRLDSIRNRRRPPCDPGHREEL